MLRIPPCFLLAGVAFFLDDALPLIVVTISMPPANLSPSVVALAAAFDLMMDLSFCRAAGCEGAGSPIADVLHVEMLTYCTDRTDRMIVSDCFGRTWGIRAHSDCCFRRGAAGVLCRSGGACRSCPDEEGACRWDEVSTTFKHFYLGYVK